ncbi:MAG: arylsulfatase [Planctomycetota bacterium]|nr:MAG: arylsulfatase [Planctomycetota bacterium]
MSAAEKANSSRPNIIIFFADDQGYQDLGCFGSPILETPNIDRLAAEGMRFTDFYSAYCVCSASRAALLTGCYQPRLSMPGVLGPHSKVALNPDEVTIAEVVKQAGYRSMCIGKWHVGDAPETLPTGQGFDHYFGIPYSNDMARQKGWGNDPDSLDKIWRLKKWDIYNNELYRDTEIIESPVNQTTLTNRYVDEAVRFIRSNKDGPFFLYFASTYPHVPLFVSDDRYDPDPHKAYKLTIAHVDWAVGKIIETLKEEGIADNTFFVYTSDNGPRLSKKHHAGSALPLRDGKGTTYEGGMREPTVMWWPARIKPGQVCKQVAGTIDLLPTIAKIVGVSLDPNRPIDGMDISALLDDPNAPSPHDEVGYYYYKNSRLEAIRLGKWKLHFKKELELYDLRNDIGETTNVADQHPDVVARLTEVAEKYDAKLKAEVRPPWRAQPVK